MSDNMDEGRDRDFAQQADKVLSTAKDENLVTYKSKLVGVTFEGRQDVIGMLKGDEPLRVRLEPENPSDPGAVAVDVLIAETWSPIGYIAKDKNKDIREVLESGSTVYIAIASLTGGDGKSHGVNTSLEYVKVAEKVAEVEPAPKPKSAPIDDLMMAIQNYTSSIGSEKETYTSRLLGKSTEVTVVNGHMRIEGYTGGSSFPSRFYAAFDTEGNLQRILDKHFMPDNHQRAKESLIEMWGLSGESSNSYGTGIHAAMENYDKFYKLGDKIKKVDVLKTKTNVGPNKALSSNPFLAKIVKDFHDKFGGDYVRLTEQFIWMHNKSICGSIDRVKVIDADKKIIRIQDYKTNGNIHEPEYGNPDSPFRGVGKKALKEGKKQKPNIVEDTKLGKYWLQLSFYAYILESYGYTIEGLDIYWLNPNKLIKGENAWEEYSHKVIDISKEM